MRRARAQVEGKRRGFGRGRAGWSLTAIAALVVGSLTGIAPSTPAAKAQTTGFELVPVLQQGLSIPTSVRFSDDGKIFVTELAGRVKVFDSLDDPEPDLLIDLTDQVHRNGDRGLIGLEVHPDFPAVPWLWLLYSKDSVPGGEAPRWGGTDPSGNDPCPGEALHGCVATSALARLVVDPATNTVTEFHELISDQWCDQFPFHSVGTVLYRDGALYVGAGDGANWTPTQVSSTQRADYGQFGDPAPGSATPINPCNDPVTFLPGDPPRVDPATSRSGSLRAQSALRGFPATPSWLNGSIIKVHPETGHSLTNPARQTLAISGAPTGGTFTLSFAGGTTDPIPYNATREQVDNAIEAINGDAEPDILSGIDGGPLPGDPVVLTLHPSHGPNPPLIEADSTGLTGGTNPTVEVSDTPFWEPLAGGLRNPFRFTGRPQTDDLWIGDVGWEDFEEINVLSGSGDVASDQRNFGWPCFEGPERTMFWRDLGNSHCDKMYDLSEDPTTNFFHDGPMFSYPRLSTLDGCQVAGITGVAFYEHTPGGPYPAEFDGSVFFADVHGGCVFSARVGSTGVLDPSTVQLVAGGIKVVDIQPGPDGLLYLVDINGQKIHALFHESTCPLDDPLEDNDTQAAARLITPGSLQATVCGNDPDWYRVDLTNPNPRRNRQDVLVRVETDAAGENLRLTVRTPSGGTVPGVISAGNVDSVRFTSNQDGPYTILVDGAQNRAPYTLTVATCQDDRLDNEDPNNPFQLQATPPFPAVHCPTEAAEHYRFPGQAGQSWKADLRHDSRLATLRVGTVVGPDGQPVTTRGTPTEGQHQVEIPILTSGEHRFTVEDISPGPAIPYTLSLLPMTASELCPFGQRDAWGDISTLTQAAHPASWPIAGNICAGGEEDWFQVDATAFSRITSDLNYDPRGPGTLALDLFDQNGNLVASGQPATQGNTPIPGTARLSYTPEQTQPFYLRVTGSGEYGNGNYEDYQLNLKQKKQK